ncbi:hypothetical protein [Phytoactinopolyspora halotolerans]|uniref:Beta-galactosidase trimerisation domain-containing protein n=1 Tax=Phytoactinopolyspora halotolerans TaxID=1981512 RepID=A0A6L9SH77_9ACTN|nr:hypothetical protein [Phytoactinopolyspora halotolerans]NEE04715.1 hypothetical protein [Phytoactinopolyspora halotolerans]
MHPHRPRRPLRRANLETSLKPFHSFDQETLTRTARAIFRHWRPLLDLADSCSILLWVSDGSEILTWNGKSTDTFEWARYIGFCNTDADPYGERKPAERVAIPYRPGTGLLSYAELARVVATLRAVGEEEGIPTRIGATFDPGPEFAPSSFKFDRHPEILASGDDVGIGPIIRMVRHFSTLRRDDRSYAAFPDGIPDGTSFGAFLGGQAQHYLSALGFDYLWLSNGFGFSSYAWSELGESFDGRTFRAGRVAELRDRALGFWRDLTEQLTFPIEIRGTNHTAGIDIGADAVPALEVYDQGYVAAPPPNSPWGPLNHDFGIEMAGYMSRIALLPRGSGGYRFRFYANDPWFWQQPWWDFYHREPFDIHLPLSVTRLSGDGTAQGPAETNILAVDTARGVLDERCGREVGTTVSQALESAPDEAGPLVWVYPFREYHVAMAERPGSISRPYAEDWFLSAAITAGLPVNTVVATDHLSGALRAGALRDRVAVVPAGALSDETVDTLTTHVASGGHVLVYGSLAGAGDAVHRFVGVRCRDDDGGLSGDLTFESIDAPDELADGTPLAPRRLRHISHLSGGPITETKPSGSAVDVLARVIDGPDEAPYATARRLPGQGGLVLWVRSSAPFEYTDPDQRGVRRRVTHDRSRYADPAALMRAVLRPAGIRMWHTLRTPGSARAVQAVHRHRNAYWFSGYLPDTTSRVSVGFPDGAPLFNHHECWYDDGTATYHLPKSFHAECRVFVRQDDPGVLRCREIAPFPAHMSRSLRVDKLSGATVTLHLPPDVEGVRIDVDGEPIEAGRELPDGFPGDGRLVLRGITGTLTVAWPEAVNQGPAEVDDPSGHDEHWSAR